MKVVITNIKPLLHERGLRTEDLASRANISITTAHKILRGEAVSRVIADAVARTLNIASDQLIRKSEDSAHVNSENSEIEEQQND